MKDMCKQTDTKAADKKVFKDYSSEPYWKLALQAWN